MPCGVQTMLLSTPHRTAYSVCHWLLVTQQLNICIFRSCHQLPISLPNGDRSSTSSLSKVVLWATCMWQGCVQWLESSPIRSPLIYSLVSLTILYLRSTTQQTSKIPQIPNPQETWEEFWARTAAESKTVLRQTTKVLPGVQPAAVKSATISQLSSCATVGQYQAAAPEAAIPRRKQKSLSELACSVIITKLTATIIPQALLGLACHAAQKQVPLSSLPQGVPCH